MKMIQAIQHVIDGINLSDSQMKSVMQAILTDEATPAQISGFLVGMRLKGETIEEISAAAQVMRSLATPVTPKSTNLIDIVGTGGDGMKTFNISTASAIVASAAGANVAKHGNRAASSQSGSADVLEQAGINLNMSPSQVADCIDNVGVGFMFAPAHHSAMKHAIGPRKEIGIRTIFNVLGPLTNPAKTKRNFIGVYDKALVQTIINVLKKLENEHAMVVHSADGLDEISIAASTYVGEYKQGELKNYEIKPEDFGLQSLALESIVVENSEQSLAMINRVFAGEEGGAKNAIMLNAGAGIYVSGLTNSLQDGVDLAKQTIDNGDANNKFQQYIDYSQSL